MTLLSGQQCKELPGNVVPLWDLLMVVKLLYKEPRKGPRLVLVGGVWTAVMQAIQKAVCVHCLF